MLFERETQMSLSSSSSSSSSGEEDGDAQWRAAIDSVASTTAFGGSQTTKPLSNSSSQENHVSQSKSQNIKYYQLKVVNPILLFVFFCLFLYHFAGLLLFVIVCYEKYIIPAQILNLV